MLNGYSIKSLMIRILSVFFSSVECPKRLQFPRRSSSVAIYPCVFVFSLSGLIGGRNRSRRWRRPREGKWWTPPMLIVRNFGRRSWKGYLFRSFSLSQWFNLHFGLGFFVFVYMPVFFFFFSWVLLLVYFIHHAPHRIRRRGRKLGRLEFLRRIQNQSRSRLINWRQWVSHIHSFWQVCHFVFICLVVGIYLNISVIFRTFKFTIYIANNWFENKNLKRAFTLRKMKI